MSVEPGAYFRGLVRTGRINTETSSAQLISPRAIQQVSPRFDDLSNLWIVSYNPKLLEDDGMVIREFRAILDAKCTVLTTRSFQLALNGRWGDQGRRPISPEELVWRRCEARLKVSLNPDNRVVLAISGTQYRGNGGIYANLPLIQSSLNNDQLYEEYLKILEGRSQGINPVDA